MRLGVYKDNERETELKYYKSLDVNVYFNKYSNINSCEKSFFFCMNYAGKDMSCIVNSQIKNS